MQKRKMIQRQKEQSSASLIQTSLKTMSVTNRDPLLYQTPEMGIEGLIATVKSEKNLIKMLKKETIKRKKRFYQFKFSIMKAKTAINNGHRK
jgi:hypothetical protein